MIEETVLFMRPKGRQHSNVGRPPVPLFTPVDHRDELRHLLMDYAEACYNHYSDKFVVCGMGMGKARAWAFAYCWLVERGYIINNDNVATYHAFLEETLQEQVTVVREPLNREIKNLRPFMTILPALDSPKAVDRLSYTNPTKKKLTQYVAVKMKLNSIIESNA